MEKRHNAGWKYATRAMRATAYRFGDCELDLERFELRRAGEAVHVEPQVFEVLAYLVAHRERVVPKTELLAAVWGLSNEQT